MRIILLLLLSLCFALTALAQNPCRPPEITFNKNVFNLFDETQEMHLGEIMAETFDKNYRVIKDEEVNAYVRAIGERLLRHLPPTDIKFQFYVVDAPDLNAYAAAGGRIYITRKLVAFVRSEDELAGIIGHELGHGIVRHHSADISRAFKEILGVGRVGDRRDIFEKFNQLIDRQNTKRLRFKKNHDDEQQLEADRIGLIAVMAAGYDPRGFTSAWERWTESRRRNDNALSDIFGTMKPEEKRLREMLRTVAKVPPECLEKRGADSQETFEKWQSFVVTTSSFAKEEKLTALISRKSLRPSLRGDVRHLQFSPDGSYILAQDASGINVLKREPFSFVFRIEADEAKFAKFSPDSKHVVFQTTGWRVEKWSIEQKKAVLAREVYVRSRCWQSALSPDGKFFVCYSTRWNLDIIDVETNETVFRKEHFYLPSYLEYYDWYYGMAESGEREVNVLQMEFSPDGKYFLGSRVFRLTTGLNLKGGLTFFQWGVDSRQESFLAYDLEERKPVKLGGDLKDIVSMPFAFYSNDKIIGQHRRDAQKSGIFSFPSGERIEKFFLNANSYARPHEGDYIFVRPTSANPVGAYDLRAKKFFISNKTPAFDGYGDLFVSEGRDGIIDLIRLRKEEKQYDQLGTVELPKNNLGDVRTIALSPDFDWLVLSEKSRGAIWDLKTGQMKIYLRGFRGSYFDTDGNIFADFPENEKEPRTIGVVSPGQNAMAALDMVETRNTRQFGKFLVRLRTTQEEREEKKRESAKAKDNKQKNGGAEEEKKKTTVRPERDAFLGAIIEDEIPEKGTLEAYDVRNRKLLWSREFPHEFPTYELGPTGETMTLYWDLNTKAAKYEIRNKPHMTQKLKTMGEKTGDYLVQVVDPESGNLIGETFIEAGEGSFYIEKIFAAGDWLVIIDSENRVLLYSLARGELQWRFFGDSAAVNVRRSLVAIENMPGQLSLYSLENGRKIEEFLFTSSVAHAAFSRDGKRLFILTADQNYYLFDAAALSGQQVSRAAAPSAARGQNVFAKSAVNTARFTRCGSCSGHESIFRVN